MLMSKALSDKIKEHNQEAAKKLADEELIKEIANGLVYDFFVRCLRLPKGGTVIVEAEHEAAKILALLKKAGYVVTFDDAPTEVMSRTERFTAAAGDKQHFE